MNTAMHGWVGVARASLLFMVAGGWLAHAQAQEGLGYLFTTPPQRAALDKLRLHRSAEAALVEVAITPDNTALAPPQPIKVNGFVSSGSGQQTYWIGGSPSSSAPNVKTGASEGRVDVVISPNGRKISIKPGQIFEAESGQVRETYQSSAAPAPSSTCRSTKIGERETRIVCGK